MSMSPKLSQLAALTDQELASRYDALAQNTVVGTAFYLDEINRRYLAGESRRMLALTQTMARLTWFIAALTVVNMAAVVYPMLSD
ncbi:hypothetical protein LN458_07140 [Xanthomonas arboricola]|uniref:hypothetical protein n=1 Tax=Xanthomonas arboricola TaxID=56448 RepID=UPI001E2A1AB1|nr:hypothetical protein [Xanthomonas arboricola]MCC8473765.1 hypothetical protein [Xanthomonas arboricola]